MGTDDQADILRQRFSSFAQKYIAERDLNTDEFPTDIWDAMFTEGLFEINLKENLGGNYLSLAVAGEALVYSGGCMGITLSWFMHQLMYFFFLMGFGTSRQQELYNRLSRAHKITALAVSEPKVGANPKMLATTAVREGDFYILNGCKSMITNAPIADLFIVIACTSEQDGINRYSALLVPKDTPGLQVTPLSIPFLKPSPHGKVEFINCRIPAENLLGREGSAFDDMVKPFSDLEDALLMGPMVGAFQRQFDKLLVLRRDDMDNEDIAGIIGQMFAMISTERFLAYEVAKMLDRDTHGPDFFGLMVVFRNLARQIHTLAEQVLPIEKLDDDFITLRSDLQNTISLTDKVARLKQKKLGRSLLRG